MLRNSNGAVNTLILRPSEGSFAFGLVLFASNFISSHPIMPANASDGGACLDTTVPLGTTLPSIFVPQMPMGLLAQAAAEWAHAEGSHEGLAKNTVLARRVLSRAHSF